MPVFFSHADLYSNTLAQKPGVGAVSGRGQRRLPGGRENRGPQRAEQPAKQLDERIKSENNSSSSNNVSFF